MDVEELVVAVNGILFEDQEGFPLVDKWGSI